VTYAYTKGWLTSVPGFASAISYHPNGLVNQVTHANGVVYTQQNDPYGIGRPAGMTSFKGTTALWQSGAYSYDGAGNVKSMGTGFSFLYDSLSRVVDARLPGGASQLYTYDDFGNLTSLTTGGTLQNTPASTTTNRLTGTTTSYDGAGNLTAWNGNTYTYDNFNQLVRAKSGAEEWVYVYTADDERFWSYRVGGGGSLWSLRDLSGQVLREYQAHVSWSTFEDYVYRGDQPLAGLPSSGEQRHFDLDHLGTIRLVTNAAGNATGVHRYYPFGKEQTTLQESDRRKWAGHERDLANLSGDGDDLDYMHARHYSPVVGRFLSVDRAEGDLKDPRSWNKYSYTLGNPLKYIDPDGEAARCPPGGCHEPKTFWEKVERGFQLASMLPGPMAMAVGPRVGLGLFSSLSTKIGQLLGRTGVAVEVASFSRALTAADLGLQGTVNEVSGTFSMTKGLATVRVDMIDAAVKNPFQIVGNLVKLATKSGASALRIEGSLANEKLLTALAKRYGLKTQGGIDYIMIYLKK
jgi:RHS repeat-associated protein